MIDFLVAFFMSAMPHKPTLPPLPDGREGTEPSAEIRVPKPRETPKSKFW